jgi:hypothetical protein
VQTLGLFAFGLCAYVLAAHAEQGPPNCPAKPALHTQAVAVTDAAGDMEFAGHCEHAVLPITFLYCPGAHSAHALFSPEYPTLQKQSERAVFPVANVTEFAGHAVHSELPVVLLYVFRPHVTQFPPSVPEYP